MIKTIIFDFGGVIGTDSDTIFIEVLVKHGISKEKAVEIWEQHWPNLNNGTCGVQELWNSVEQELKLNISLVTEEYNKKIQVYPKTIDICRKLKLKGFKLGILANESLEWMDIKRKKGNLNSIFDKVYSSADIKSFKPDAESYNYVLNALNSKPEETLFIDNRGKNTEAAKNIGMKTILFKDCEQLKKELVSFSIYIE